MIAMLQPSLLWIMVSAAASAPAPAPAPAPAASRWSPPGESARLAESSIDRGRTRWRPGAGLEVRSADKRFSLQFNVLTQLQASVRHTPAIAATADDPGRAAVTDLALVLRRARLVLGGNIFTPHIKYKIQLTASPIELGWKDGKIQRAPILDWYFTFDRLRDATVQIGQYKVPYNHQRMLRVTGMQFVDRSTANNEFTMDRDIGLDVRSNDLAGLGHLRYYAGVYLGDGIALHRPGDLGLAYVARLELLPFGLYDDLEEADHERGARPRMLLGGAFAYIDRDPHDNHGFFGQIPADGGKTSTLNATADMNFRLAGFSFEGGLFWRQATRRIPGVQPNQPVEPDPPDQAIPVVAPRNGLAYFTQAGYLLPRLPLELALRWGQIFGQGGPTRTSLPDQNEVGGALSHYFVRHWLKLQLDYMRLFSGRIDRGADQIRVQLQASF